MPDFLDATAGWTGSPGPIREPRGNSKSLRTVTADRLVVGPWLPSLSLRWSSARVSRRGRHRLRSA